MIVVKVRDNRTVRGEKPIFFESNVVTPEIYMYVKKHKNAYYIQGICVNESDKINGYIGYRRDDFLKKFKP